MENAAWVPSSEVQIPFVLEDKDCSQGERDDTPQPNMEQRPNRITHKPQYFDDYIQDGGMV